MRLTASFFIACLFVSSSQNAHAQQEVKPKREGVITGRVLADGRPVGGANVIVQAAGGKIGDLQTTASDDDGNFRVTGLSPGTYSLLTQIPGYVMPPDSSGPSRHRIGENVSINLIKGAVITGRVTDEFGEPIVGVRVVAYRVRTLEGKPEFDSKALNVTAAGRETDDRGAYRLFGLEPGIYVVSLNGLAYSIQGLVQSRGAPPVYHPHPREMQRQRSSRRAAVKRAALTSVIEAIRGQLGQRRGHWRYGGRDHHQRRGRHVVARR